ncbi:MAG: IS66 family transposase [Gammaproteobacteria bacterium]|nr:MAG: IS66 family transposase [Gammaproteobacteria bacterium]
MVESAVLPDDVESLKTLVIERDLEIQQLREYVRLLKSQRFGASSERIHRDQLGLFNEAEQILDMDIEKDEHEEALIEVPSHTRARGGRRPLPAWMPREEILHDLSEEEKICAHDGEPLVEIGRETSEQVEFIPATARVLVHVRPKYGCPRCKTGVRIAPMPPQPIPKSVASPSLLAYVAVSKYADALPLYRQQGMLERIGIEISRATLAAWMIKLGELVGPLINLMREELLESGFVQCDESRYQVLKEPGKSAESLSYIWVQRATAHGHPLILYEYDRSRSAEVPKRLFEGYEGVLQTDGYEGYGAIGREPGIIHAGCWAHARRKFTDALKVGGKNRKKGAKRSKKQSKAEAGLRFIQKLYAVEREVKEASPEERVRVRQDRSLPILSDLRQWLDESLGAVVPQSLTGKALAYLNGQWPKLVRVFEHGEVPIDTNLVENAIRPFAIGRKNWMFADTVHGAEASANLYSLVETAKANDLEPWAYLERVFEEIPRAETLQDFDALLPHRIRLRNDAVN